MLIFLHAVTDLGDTSITLSLTLFLSLYLAVIGERRYAATVLTAFAGTAFVVGLLKIILYSRCHAALWGVDLESPSGHTALTTAVFGTAALIVTRSAPQPQWRWLALAATAFLMVSVAVSRVVLGFHTIAEILVGAGVGVLTLVLVAPHIHEPEKAKVPWTALILVALVPLLLLHRIRLPAETFLDGIADHLHQHWPSC